jgi:MoaA/NifB/PqqE/SkfB family radical SAM enzyme
MAAPLGQTAGHNEPCQGVAKLDLVRTQVSGSWKARPARLAIAAVRWGASHIPLAFFKRIPRQLIIDVTNSCNLRCPVCPVTFAMTRPRGLMSFELFRLIIDDFIAEEKKPEIFFNFSGEPTLNKHLPEMISYASESGHSTFVSTNATRLGPELAERMIESGLSRIALCLDGFSKSAQESYRVNSDFDTVKANIETFLAVRRRLGARNPTTVLQTLLTSYSEVQIAEILKWATECGFDRVRLKTFSLGSHTSPEMRAAYSHFLPTNRALRRHSDASQSILCSIPRSQAVIFWNGELGLCCIDYDQVIRLPNVKEKGFLTAFRSDEAARARRCGFAKQFKICHSCSYSNADKLGFVVDLRSACNPLLLERSVLSANT